MSRSAALIGVLIVCAACASTGPIEVDPSLRLAALQVLENAVPQRCTMVHKVTIRVAGRDLVLTGHLLLDRARGLRAVAVDEFGGPVMAFTACGQTTSVDMAPARISAEIIKNGPLRDLQLLYLRPAEPPTVISVDGARAVLQWRDGDATVAATVDLEQRRLLTLSERRGRRVQREMVFDPPADDGGASAGAATDFVVHNRRLHYRMRAQVLAIDDAEPGPELQGLESCAQ